MPVARRRVRKSVERAERLVEQQHAWVAGERARERHALPLAAGDPVRTFAAQCREAERVEELRDTGLPSVGDVLLDRQVWEQRVLLEDEPDRPALGRHVDVPRAVVPDGAARGDAAFVGAEQARDRAEHGRLARARRADERERLRAYRELELESEGAKTSGDRDVERVHERRRVTAAMSTMLTATRSAPSAIATSKSRSSSA